MRVIVYVPSVRGVGRTRPAVERDARAEIEAEGHDVEFVDFDILTPDDARRARDAGLMDLIVGRPEHVFRLCQAAPDLLHWCRDITPRPREGKTAAVVALPALAWQRVRRHPGRAAAIGVGVAGAVLAAAMLAPDDPSPPRALPPPSAPPTTRPPTVAPPTTGPPVPTPTRPPPARSKPAPSSASPGRAGTVATPTADRPSNPPRSASPPTTRPPSTTRPSTSPSPAPSPSRSPRCIVDLDIFGLPVRLCLPQPISV